MATRLRTTGDRLRELRETKGYDLDEAKVELGRVLPRGSSVSRETIRRYETEYADAQMNPLVLVGLANIYGCAISDIADPTDSAELSAEMVRMRDMWLRTPGCLTAGDATGKPLVTAAA